METGSLQLYRCSIGVKALCNAGGALNNYNTSCLEVILQSMCGTRILVSKTVYYPANGVLGPDYFDMNHLLGA